jgi:hypothetical protein
MFQARIPMIVKFFSISGDEKAKLQTALPSKLGAPLSITRLRGRVFPRFGEASSEPRTGIPSSYLVIWSSGHLVIDWSIFRSND